MTWTTTDPDERRAYIALALLPGLGPRSLAALLSACSTPLRVFSQSTPDHRYHHLVADVIRDRAGALASAAAHEAEVAARGIALLTPADAAYPALLRSIPDPPLLLYAAGDPALASRPAVAIVGSRDHSSYGRDMTREIAGAAAAAGIVVISGMARGLDAAAHHAALDAGGTSIGVLGSGIGIEYPASNRDLYRRMTDQLLLSEHPPMARPGAGAFPRRNRLISGLAQVLVVVEGAQGSGTMLTVAAALEQGRTVMAVPGPINSPTSAGTNALLRDGAEPLLAVGDLLAKFPAVPSSAVSAPVTEIPCTLSREEAIVFALLGPDPRSLDELVEAAGLPVSTTLGVLCGLELGGLAEQVPGSSFRRANAGGASRLR